MLLLTLRAMISLPILIFCSTGKILELSSLLVESSNLFLGLCILEPLMGEDGLP